MLNKLNPTNLILVGLSIMVGVLIGYFIFSTPDENKQIYATYGNGKVVKGKEVLEKIKEPLHQLNYSIFELKKKATQQIILEKLGKGNENSPDDRAVSLPNLSDKKFSKKTQELKSRFQRMQTENNIKLTQKLNDIDIKWKLKNPNLKTVDLDPGKLQAVSPSGAQNKIIIFTQYFCDFCSFPENQLKELQRKFGPRFQIYYRFLVNENDPPLNMLSAQAAYCAHEKNKFSEFHEKMLQVPPKTEEELKETIRSVGLTEDCVLSGKYTKQMIADRLDAQKAEITQVPSVILNGFIFPGTTPYFVLSDVVK